jgi:hypothetical protein
MDLLIDLVGHKANRRHVFAHFTSLVRVNRYGGISIDQHLDRGTRSDELISLHLSSCRLIPCDEPYLIQERAPVRIFLG